MTVRPFLPYADRRLHMPADPVEAVTETVRMIWDDMVDTMDAMPGVGLGCRTLLISPAFPGAEFSIFVPANPVLARSVSRHLFRCVMLVMTRRPRFLDPGRQQLQIQKIGRLDWRSAHHVHLLEPETESNANTRRLSTRV